MSEYEEKDGTPEIFQRFLKTHEFSSYEIQKRMEKAKNIESFEKEIEKEFLASKNTVGMYLGELTNRYLQNHKISLAGISELAGQSGTYLGNIINGKRENPKRNVLIKLCIVLEASLNEINYLLKYSGYAELYFRNQRDSVIIFGIKNQLPIGTINDQLKERNLEAL